MNIMKLAQWCCEGSTSAGAAGAGECCRSREHEGGDLKGEEEEEEVGEVRNLELGIEEVIDRPTDGNMNFLFRERSGINNAI